LIKGVEIGPEDLLEIEYYKRKLVIDDFFKRVLDRERRKAVFKRLMLHYHPDKNKGLDPQLASQLFQYLRLNKIEFKEGFVL